MLSISGYGRVASDINLKRNKKQTHLYSNFLFASHYKRETIFIRCVAFDGTATLLNEYVSKGDRIMINGNLISDDYNSSKYVFKILVKEFEFVETKKEHETNKDKHQKIEKEVK